MLSSRLGRSATGPRWAAGSSSGSTPWRPLPDVRDRVGDPAVVIVPAGERWPDGSLRPAVEDLWGAGAVVDAIVSKLEHRAGPMLLSAEAAVALAAWSWVTDRVRPSLEACASGRELIDQGFGDDVQVAAEVDVSDHVPVLVEGAFVRESSPRA